MRPGSLLFLLLLLVSSGAWAQHAHPRDRFAHTITAHDLRQRLEIVASDSMEGRETGTPGLLRAADYIENQFRELGLGTVPRLGSFRQPYLINVTHPDTVRVLSGKDTFRLLEDIYCFNLPDMRLEADGITYLGHGIHSPAYSDYEGRDVRGKVLMVSSGEPKRSGRALADTSLASTEWTSDWRLRAMAAQQRGAKALLVIDDRFSSTLTQLRRYLQSPSLNVGGKEEATMPLVYISSRLADRLLKGGGQRRGHRWLEDRISKKGKPEMRQLTTPMTLEVRRHREKMPSENVMAYLPGTDKEEETIVISCHYDHLGMKDGEIYNGADDDGSGTVAMLELAEAFAIATEEGHRPRRSILFIAFSGEEKGLLGSEHYANRPAIPLSQTMVNLNIDMIGRIDKHHAPDSNYVYIIGSDKLSSDLHALSEAVNASHGGIAFDYRYNDERDPNRFYYRSDHYNFAKNGIPVIFYFTGVHEDYHKPTDTVDKIMFPKTERIVRLIFHTVWELANREEAVVRDR